MERLADLISKLKEQFEHSADPSQMLMTTKRIEAELLRTEPVQNNFTSSKISVVMPALRSPAPASGETTAPTQKQHSENSFQLSKEQHKLAEEAVDVLTQATELPADNSGKNSWLFDPIHEVPTLAHQEPAKDLNEIVGNAQLSLNERLKGEIVEIGHQLTETPIRDLKKAIGINDRFVFVEELFRGDEVMYERSIKTINAFRIYAEAEYWIERELKVKLGWEEDNPTTRYFYQLVKRRFS